MGIDIQKLTYQDINIYKEYQEKYYTQNPPHYIAEHDLHIGQVERIKDSFQNGIIIGLSGLNHYVYVIFYHTKSHRYWSSGMNESSLIPIKQDIADDENLYNAFENWLIRNNFNICTDDFKKFYESRTKNKHIGKALTSIKSYFKPDAEKERILDNVVYVDFSKTRK